MKNITTLNITTVAEANAAHERITSLATNALAEMQAIGKWLLAEKAKLGHGNFVPFVEKNLTFSIRSAQYYIKMWEERALLKNATVAFLKEGIRATTKSKTTQSTTKPAQSTAKHKPATLEDKVRDILAAWERHKLPMKEHYYIVTPGYDEDENGESFLCYGEVDEDGACTGDTFGAPLPIASEAQSMADDLNRHAQDIVVEFLQGLLDK